MANALAETRVDQLTVAPPASVAGSPMLALLSDAIQKGMGIEVIREIKALSTEMAADEARRAFDAAMSDAKAEIPVILKNKLVGFETKGGGETSYRHEDLGQIARTIDPILAKFGLSYRFRTEAKPGEPVSVTCIVAHRAGHFEENTLAAGRDDSGKKNAIQQIGSTITYLQRYTLKAALGLAAAYDDDGKGSEPPETISDEQIDEINALIDQAVDVKPGTDRAAWLTAFLGHMKAESLMAIPAKDFGKAKAAIRATIQREAGR